MIWLLSTRNRQQMCQNTIDAMWETGFREKCIIFQDGCQYNNLKLPFSRFEIRKSETNIGVCAQANWLFVNYPEESSYGFICDDMLPVTSGWSFRIKSNWQIHSCEDELTHGKKKNGKHWVGSAMCIGGKLAREVGYLAIPGTFNCGVDWLWASLGRELDLLRFHPKILVRHLHWRNGLRENDKITLQNPFVEQEKLIRKFWLKNELPNVVARVRKAMKKEKPE